MSTHISQIYSCSKINLAFELYYVSELGKYSLLNYGSPVSLEGVVLDSVLSKSIIWQYFRFAVKSGWLVVDNAIMDYDLRRTIEVTEVNPLASGIYDIKNFKFTTEQVVYDSEDASFRVKDKEYALNTPKDVQVVISKRDNGIWSWTAGGIDSSHNAIHNLAFNHNLADYAWSSFMAFVTVERLYTGVPTKLLVTINKDILINAFAFSQVLLLKDETQALGWMYFATDATLNKEDTLQMGYTAWYSKGRELGYLRHHYTAKEKLDRMAELDIQVGDLVFVYDRAKSQSKNNVKSIESCRVAKIISLDSRRISFEFITTTQTYTNGRLSFEDRTMAVKALYAGKFPYEQLITMQESFDLLEVGVEYYLYDELMFILPLEQAEDMKEQWVSRDGRVDKLILSQNDLIYWILEDYKYEYNRERFLSRYFSNKEPLRDRYMRGDVLEDYHFAK